MSPVPVSLATVRSRWLSALDLLGAFGGNPHIVKPSRKDYELQLKSVHSTFPTPLPPYLPRATTVPSSTTLLDRKSSSNIPSSHAGRFSLSLRGVRRELRGRGPRGDFLVKEVEEALQVWLSNGNQPVNQLQVIDKSDRPVITEVSRTPLQVVWKTDDAFARWIIHCVARWHGVVSFSKSRIEE